MKTLLILLFCIVVLPAKSNQIFAQDSTDLGSNRIFLSTSLSYKWEPDFGRFHEFTYNLGVGYSLNPRWNVGVSALRLWVSDTISGVNTYLIWGPFAQYNISVSPNSRLFVEGGLYAGDFCNCGDNFPYRSPGNFYWALGGGFTHRIKGNLFMEVGFHSFNIFNAIPKKYNFTQYIIGLEYQL